MHKETAYGRCRRRVLDGISLPKRARKEIRDLRVQAARVPGVQGRFLDGDLFGSC